MSAEVRIGRDLFNKHNLRETNENAVSSVWRKNPASFVPPEKTISHQAMNLVLSSSTVAMPFSSKLARQLSHVFAKAYLPLSTAINIGLGILKTNCPDGISYAANKPRPAPGNFEVAG